MVTTSGNLFHIDFGHFLGNKKEFLVWNWPLSYPRAHGHICYDNKWTAILGSVTINVPSPGLHRSSFPLHTQGVNRERAPFVLTPDFEYVMGKRVREPTVASSFMHSVASYMHVVSCSQNSEMFRRFEETAVKAYLIIRKNANMFINLFSMVREMEQWRVLALFSSYHLCTKIDHLFSPPPPSLPFPSPLQMKCTGIPELRSVEDIEYLRSVLVLDKSEKVAEDHFKSQIQKCLKVQWSTQINWLTHNWAHRN